MHTEHTPRRWSLAMLALLLVGVLAFAVAGCGDDEEEGGGGGQAANVEQFPENTTMGKIQKKGELTVGVKFDVPPFGFKNPQTNEVEGFDIDFGKAIAKKLGVEFKPVEAISDNRIPFIQKGTVDLILSTMTINEERVQEIGFTDPYFIAHGRILVKKGSPIGDVADLPGKRVCTALGSTYEETLKKEAPKAELKLVDTYSECLELIQNGAVDAVSTDDVILTGMIIQDDTLEMVGDELTTEPYGGGFKKDDEEFRKFLNGVLEEYKGNGGWQRAYDKWLGRYTGQRQAPPTEKLEDVVPEAGT